MLYDAFIWYTNYIAWTLTIFETIDYNLLSSNMIASCARRELGCPLESIGTFMRQKNWRKSGETWHTRRLGSPKTLGFELKNQFISATTRNHKHFVLHAKLSYFLLWNHSRIQAIKIKSTVSNIHYMQDSTCKIKIKNHSGNWSPNIAMLCKAGKLDLTRFRKGKITSTLCLWSLSCFLPLSLYHRPGYRFSKEVGLQLQPDTGLSKRWFCVYCEWCLVWV